MLTNLMLSCFKSQIGLCRFLGFNCYKFSKKDKTFVESIHPKGSPWKTVLFAIVTSFGFFVGLNGLYVTYRLSATQVTPNNFGIASLVLIAMTSVALLADVSINLIAWRKSMEMLDFQVTNLLNMMYNLEKLDKPSSQKWSDLTIIGVMYMCQIASPIYSRARHVVRTIHKNRWKYLHYVRKDIAKSKKKEAQQSNIFQR
ncbi:hypothetical protein Fcan01_15463 [Folsomia candida]|uniref:Uncharacterized protein n=1 Tax=Folsomia candida TaxID=158441 RepID=A0A226DZI6_FOLCA|nr:hypothetical protein Fcan01_15463 [Folsomia candida]